MTTRTRSKMNTQIYEEAGEWFVEFRTGDIDEAARREFDAWVRTSPEHLRAYLEIAAIWNEGASLDGQRKLDVETLTTRARTEGNVVPLDAAAHYEPVAHATSRVFPEKRGFLIAASIALLCVITGAFTWLQINSAPTYSTGIGKQRFIALADGSSIDLNAKSKVRVRFTEQTRHVELLEGQALFKVAKDKARPFIVYSGATRVRAVGTQFDVYRKSSGTIVTVLEGQVAVLPEGFALSLDPIPLPDLSASAQPSSTGTGTGLVLLSAGEQVTVTPQKIPRPAPADISAATAWTQQQLMFESTPLAEVAEEFNRYNARRLEVKDPALANFRISGVFSSTDGDFLVRFLRQRPDILVRETDEEIQISRK